MNARERGVSGSHLVGLIDDDFAAVGIETDIDMDQLAQPLADQGALVRIDQEHHEAAAAGAQKLAADGTGVAPGLVDVVDLRIGDARGELALDLPRLVHQLAELAQRRLRIEQDVGGAVDQAADHAQLVLAAVHILDLVLGEIGGEARKPGEEQHQRLRKLRAPRRRQDERQYREGAVLVKVDAVEAAIGRPDLVLAADVFLEHFLLDADRFAAEVALTDHPGIERVERVQEPDRERAARAQSGAGRQVGIVMDLKALGHAHVGQDAAHRRVLDLGQLLDQFDLGINDLRLVLEERRQPAHADVAIFVDRGADHRAAVLAKPRRIIGAAAEQRDAKRGAADDHTSRCSNLAMKTRSASLSDSGVPMSMKANGPAKASSEPEAARPNTSRSSDAALPAEISSSSAAENR